MNLKVCLICRTAYWVHDVYGHLYRELGKEIIIIMMAKDLIGRDIKWSFSSTENYSLCFHSSWIFDRNITLDTFGKADHL
jgi:hypothetical protein